MNTFRSLRESLRGFLLLTSLLLIPSLGFADSPVNMKPFTALFDQPGANGPRDLYKLAHEAFSANNLDGARLLAMRVFLDGHRSQNLLDLLGAIEIKANHPLLAAEWLRKALCLSLEDSVARKILLRLPPPARPIPMDQGTLDAHFAQISKKLPQLLGSLNSARLHADSILDELSRGQFYKALALSEEYEKRYPGINGTGLTALCAFYLGRNRDALQLAEQGLTKDPYHPLLLFVKAMISDTHPETSAPNRPRALFDQDQWHEAAKVADQFTSQFPRSAEGILVKARIAMERNQLGIVKTLLDEASQRDPDHPWVDLMKADLAILQKQPTQAAGFLERAFRRGYNLPAVNLKAALIAARNGKTDEGGKILEESEALQPFLDRDAFPLYVELAIVLDRMQSARSALDLWQARFPYQSQGTLLEAWYQFKSANDEGGRDLLRKALAMNPERGTLLSLLSSIPAVRADPKLARQPPPAGPIPRANQQVVKAPKPVAPTPPPPASPPNPPPASPPSSGDPATQTPADPSQIAAPGNRYSYDASSGLAANVVENLKAGIEAAIDRVETLFGIRPTTVAFLLIPPSGQGSHSVTYDPGTAKISLSSQYLDYPGIKKFLDGERPDLEEDQKINLSQNLSGHMLAVEVAQALIAQQVMKLDSHLLDTAWIRTGLAEIAGGNEVVIKDRLVFTQNKIASGEIKLYSLDQTNRGLAADNQDFTSYQAARAHAYLMVSYLLKREPSPQQGFSKLVVLMKGMVSGKSLSQMLPQLFGLSITDFETGWKEAAYWALKNSQPYEW